MPPRRKSQADLTKKGEGSDVVDTSAPVEEVGKTSMPEEEVASATAGGVSTADITRAAHPISFSTKQQKDAASGADGIDQYELARTQVTKVAKSAIPENVQLRKEVILGLIKSSTVFINYLASSALDKTHEAGNKTLSATHVINAFKEMGFPEQYAEQLRKDYNDKVKVEADRAKASKAAKADAARAEEQSMDVDADESRTEARAAEDESMAVDLSKEEPEEEGEEEERGDVADGEEEAEEGEDAGGESGEEEDEDEEGGDGEAGEEESS